MMNTDVDAVLMPVDRAAPAGADLRYQPIYDEIKAARRIAEADPAEPAPWKKVAELALKATTRSKDLQLAIWLLEAFARIDGFRGASTGLLILRRLLQEYWDSVYPQMDPEDAEPLGFRRALLDWVDDKLSTIVRSAPLTGPPAFYGLIHYEVTQKTGDEKKALLDEGWPSSERFDEALQATATPYLEGLLEDLTACDKELAALQAVADERFNAPTGAGAKGAHDRGEPLKFVRLREAFETARWLIERPLKKRRQDKAPQPAKPEESLPAVAAEPAIARAVVDILGPGVNGDEVWAQALTLTRGSRVEGLRLVQGQLAASTSGRDRFLRQLQLAELSLEAGIYSLAFPVFDDLARTIDARQLEEWEDRSLIERVLKGLARCCGLVKPHHPAAASRETEILDRLARLHSSRSG